MQLSPQALPFLQTLQQALGVAAQGSKAAGPTANSATANKNFMMFSPTTKIVKIHPGVEHGFARRFSCPTAG